MNKLAKYFTDDFKHWFKIDFFKRALYVFLFFNTLTLFPIVNDVFGYNGLGGFKPFYWSGTSSVINLLSHPINHNHQWITWFFYFGQLLFLALGFLRIKPLFSSVAIWFFTVNLFSKGNLFFTGGEVFINIMLFYLIFIQDNTKVKHKLLQTVLNNTFYIILLIQVCVLYFFSFLWKLFDENWINGYAIFYVSQIDSFSSSWLKALLDDNLVLSRILTYSVIIYQFSFPVLVWIKKIKIPLLVFGVVFHLMISFGMGIFAFGFFMILSYLLFLDDNQIFRLKQILRIK